MAAPLKHLGTGAESLLAVLLQQNFTNQSTEEPEMTINFHASTTIREKSVISRQLCVTINNF